MLLSNDVKMQKKPLLVVPVGHKHNSLFRQLYFRTLSDNTIKNIISAGDSFLNNTQAKVSVMKVTPRTQNSDSSLTKNFKSVYSSVGISIGPYRDAKDESLLEKFWYFGPLKKPIIAVTQARNTGFKPSFEVKWTDCCSGCRRCKSEEISVEKKKLRGMNRSLWGSNVGKKEVSQESIKILKFDKIDNPACSRVHSRVLSDIDHVVLKPSRDCIEITVVSGSSKTELFWESMRRFRDRDAGSSAAHSGSVSRMNAKEAWLDPIEGKFFPDWFSLDNQNFEAVPIYAKFCRDKVNSFRK